MPILFWTKATFKAFYKEFSVPLTSVEFAVSLQSQTETEAGHEWPDDLMNNRAASC